MFSKPVRNNSDDTKTSPPSYPSSSTPSQSAPAASPAPASAAPQQQPQSSPGARGNRLSADVEIKGKITFPDELLVDGQIEGEITSNGVLTIGENSKIKAEINTRAVTIHGKVQGNITVQEHIDIRRTAEIIGDISAATVSMESGASLVGRSVIGKQAASAAAKSIAPKNAKADKTSSKEVQGDGKKPLQAELPKT